MSIFGIIKCDDQVFAGDKIRINAIESFLAQGLLFPALLSHEISVDNGVTWYDITAKKGIDWVFSTAGIKTISLRLNTTQPASQVFTKDVSVLDIAAANLFSRDFDLYAHEPEIDQYLPKKWSSWNIIHKRAQDWIIDWLDEKGIFAEDGSKYGVVDLMDKQQVKQLSVYKSLQFIFEGNSNIVGDLFSIKASKYELLSNTKASRSQLDLDFNKNTIKEPFEKTNLHKIIVRRS